MGPNFWKFWYATVWTGLKFVGMPEVWTKFWVPFSSFKPAYMNAYVV